jgi:hypothetical protein
MDIQRMLEKCKSQQWKIDDLNWDVEPRSMERDEEIAVVQYFKDMAGIERFAKALFVEQQKIVTDPTLKAIFATFVVDEERHAQVAERLAAHYDVHRYREYTTSPELERFKPSFMDTLKYLSAEVANAYITGGELLLDVALLRSLNDYVHDDMSQRAMDLINRDESRHIAMDYHMTEFYASDEYQQWLAQQPKNGFKHDVKAFASFARLLASAAPFFRQVFFQPMARIDPSGKRLREAVKRMQLLGNRKKVAGRPFYRFMNSVNTINRHPVWGRVLGGITNRISGDFPVELRGILYTQSELKAANDMSIDAMADEALKSKTLN